MVKKNRLRYQSERSKGVKEEGMSTKPGLSRAKVSRWMMAISIHSGEPCLNHVLMAGQWAGRGGVDAGFMKLESAAAKHVS